MRKTPALLAALLLAAAPALAQTETPPEKAPQGGAPHAQSTGPARSGTTPDTYHAMLNRRITVMQQRLHITAAEEPAWNSFVQTMRDNADNVEQAYQKRASDLNTMTAPENLHDYAQIEQLRAEDVQKLATSFDTLYGQLSDQQKKTADAMFRQYDVEQQHAHRAAAARSTTAK